MQQWPDDVTLEGQYARLEPLGQQHHDDLVEASNDGDLHKLWYTWIPDAGGMATEIDARNAKDDVLAFAIIEKASGKAVGMTTYMNIDGVNKRVEIGSTWYRQSVQRGPINTECKLLMLTHAFESLSCIAVEFRTHALNLQSRRAIERLGAKFDGMLRNHTVMRDGTLRDTAIYSIINSEWPTVKTHLNWQMKKPRD